MWSDLRLIALRCVALKKKNARIDQRKRGPSDVPIPPCSSIGWKLPTACSSTTGIYIYILIICTFLYVWIHIRTSSYTSLNSVYILRIKNSHCQWYLCHVCILAPNTFPCWPQQSDWSNSKEHKRIQMNHKTTFHIERFFRLLKLSLCNCGRMAFAAKSRSFLIQGRKCGCCFLQEGADRAIQRVLHHWMKGIIWNHGNHASVECPRPKSS